MDDTPAPIEAVTTDTAAPRGMTRGFRGEPSSWGGAAEVRWMLGIRLLRGIGLEAAKLERPHGKWFENHSDGLARSDRRVRARTD